MNNELILQALNESYNLQCSESESVCDDDLMREYARVIELLEKAIADMDAR